MPSPQHSTPHRRRRWDTASILVLAVACAALAIGLVNLSDGFLVRQSELGLRLSDTAQGVLVTQIVADGPAARAGLQPGDRILAVDGAAASDALGTSDTLSTLPEGMTAELEIERSGELLETQFAPAHGPRGMHPHLYLWLVGLAFLGSGTLLMLRQRRAGLMPYYLLSLAAWALLAYSHSGRASAFDWSIYWLDTAARCWLPALALHCALLYPRPLMRPRVRLPLVALAYTGSALLFSLSVWLIARGGAYRFADPVAALEATDRLQLLYLALGLGGSAAALVAHRLRQRDRLVRRQLQWIEWGSAAALAPFVLFYLLPAGLGAETGPWHSLALLPLGLLPIACSVALAQRHLADLEVFLKRGVALAAQSLTVVGCYLMLHLALRALLGGWSRLPDELPMLLAVVATALLTPRLRELIHAQVDRLFYLDKYDYRKTLIQFSRELNSERGGLPPVLERFLERVVQTLEVGRAAVFVLHTPSTFSASASYPRSLSGTLPRLGAGSAVARALRRSDHLNVAAPEAPPPARIWAQAGFEHLVAMRVKGQLVALLAVGARASGASLTREDLQLLITVCGHAAMAIEGARLYSEVQRRVEEVEKLNALSDAILQGSSIGILVVAPGGTIYRANEAAEQLLGGSLQGARSEDRLPAPILGMLGAAGPPSRPDAVRRLYRLPLELDRGRRVVNASVALLHLPGVGSGASVLTLDDVTGRVKLEEKLLQNERLASIGLLAAGVAHEVNTPLTGICSYTQMLLAELEADDTRAALLRKVETQAFRASDIIKGLLNFARGGDQSFAPTDLNDTVEEAVALFEPHLRNTPIQIEHDLARSLPKIWGIRREIQQVVVNLLLNARDAMPRGGRIRISTRQSPAGIELRIEDTGRGIPSADLHRIYDPFFTTKGLGRGTGLGLSVTYGIVRKHSGSIDVRSSPEHGTVFTVFLPGASETSRALVH
ncbi:MAG: ATP-binding protein [Acidobacteriota bacterium]